MSGIAPIRLPEDSLHSVRLYVQFHDGTCEEVVGSNVRMHTKALWITPADDLVAVRTWPLSVIAYAECFDG